MAERLHAVMSMSHPGDFSTPGPDFLSTLAHFLTVFVSVSLLFPRFLAEFPNQVT
jgi:hypothetical protein